ncbi:SoxS protein [Paracoccus indicus]|uniref:SoxS protein n=1 Tax=Paracoccus indicus TaxID=2079229 RepID=UPI001FE56446|nr:SoxS protein [Paracoccus indicus]
MSVLTRRMTLAMMTAVLMPGIARARQTAPDWKSGSLRLMMVSESDCEFCREWRSQIAPGFARSGAGRRAPLFEVDLNGPYPDGLALAGRPRVTPSFILLDRGSELGRIEGYVGAQDFYPVLERMMAGAGVDVPRWGA